MKKHKITGIKQKLTNCFLKSISIANVAAIISIVFLLILANRYKTALEHNGFIQGDIGEYNTFLQEGGANARDLIFATDSHVITESQYGLEKCDKNATYYFEEIEKKVENADERAILDSIMEKYLQYIDLRNQAIETKNSVLFYEEVRPLLKEITALGESLLKMNKEMGDSVSASLTMTSICLIIVIILVIILGGLVSMKLANNFSNNIVGVIDNVRIATQKLANGEMNVTLDIHTGDEFEHMANNFNTAVTNLQTYVDTLSYGLSEVASGNLRVQPNVEFQGDFVALRNSIENLIHSLNTIIGQINDGSDQVALGAEQLAQGAQGLAEGATSQAAAIEELTATIENAASAASNSAQQAIEANQTAETFASMADQSSQDMAQLTDAMARITETSKEIETIIAEIEEIADQTNLLSLNATIEAARAGEAGRGFAVVADQIGKLASDSAQSAANTRALIAKSLEVITQGNEITTKTSQALQQVVDGIKFLASASKESSESSTEQANNMQQVLSGIEQIAEVVQSNSAAAEETSATSEELSAQSQNLKALIEHFQLIDN